MLFSNSLLLPNIPQRVLARHIFSQPNAGLVAFEVAMFLSLSSVYIMLRLSRTSLVFVSVFKILAETLQRIGWLLLLFLLSLSIVAVVLFICFCLYLYFKSLFHSFVCLCYF